MRWEKIKMATREEAASGLPRRHAAAGVEEEAKRGSVTSMMHYGDGSRSSNFMSWSSHVVLMTFFVERGGSDVSINSLTELLIFILEYHPATLHPILPTKTSEGLQPTFPFTRPNLNHEKSDRASFLVLSSECGIAPFQSETFYFWLQSTASRPPHLRHSLGWRSPASNARPTCRTTEACMNIFVEEAREAVWELMMM